MFVQMGVEAFAERARRELLVTGETVRKREVETQTGLTPQEGHVARLARDGRSNPERYGTAHQCPHRRVAPEQGVRQAGITSRMGLHDALPARRRSDVPRASVSHE
jgi:hypothetical protein